MTFLYQFFGWLTRILFGFFGNYGMAIIMLTVIIRAALIPLNVKSQKSMIKMQALSERQPNYSVSTATTSRSTRKR